MNITFGINRNYLFIYTETIEKFGYDIYLDGNLVGGVLFWDSKNCGGIVAIEVLPTYRRKGILSQIVKDLLRRYRYIQGTINENDNFLIWQKLGANFYIIKDSKIIRVKSVSNYLELNKSISNRNKDKVYVLFFKIGIY